MTTPTLRLPTIPGADSSLRLEARTPGVKSLARVLIRSSLVLATALVLMACGSSSTAARHSPSPSAPAASGSSPGASTPGGPFPSPTPGGPPAVPPITFSCSSAIPPAHQLALVQLKGVSGYVVRDITDILHPVTRCTFQGGSYFRFVSETRLSYIVTASADQGAAGAMYVADLNAGTTSWVRAWANSGSLSSVYGWSPDGQALSYISSVVNNNVEWHLLSAAGDRLLAKLGTIPSRGVNRDNDDAMVGFSADGQYVAVEQTFIQGTTPPIQVNRVSDGSLAYSRTDGTMAVWAGTGARLLFRTSAGVQSWGPSGGVIPVSAGTAWIHPVASPDGSRIAFSLLNAQGNHVGEVLDLASGGIHALSPNPRVGAAFLNASLVWYAGETICTTATPCGPGAPPLSGQNYIYDLGSDVETGSIDTGFYDSWPHLVGQS